MPRDGRIGYVEDGRLHKLEGKPKLPRTSGRLCARGQAGVNIVYNPDRLLYPLKRVGKRGEGKWKRISWEEALGLLVNGGDAMKTSGGTLTVATRVKPPVSRPAQGEAGGAADGGEGPRAVEGGVTGTGTGIATEHLSRLFEPFFSTKAPGSGTGLGLSIAHDIVRSHGGDILVSSKLGRGASFRIVLPRRGRPLLESHRET